MDSRHGVQCEKDHMSMTIRFVFVSLGESLCWVLSGPVLRLI